MITKPILAMGAVASAIAAIYTVPPLLNYPAPIPAWKHQLEETEERLAGQNLQTELGLMYLQRDALQSQIWNQQRWIDEIKSKGWPTRDAVDTLRRMEVQMQRLEKRIEQKEVKQ